MNNTKSDPDWLDFRANSSFFSGGLAAMGFVWVLGREPGSEAQPHCPTVGEHHGPGIFFLLLVLLLLLLLGF